MKNNKMTTFVHQYLKENVTKADIVVDATVGNGNDTLLLAKLAKFVYGFDIQEIALANTKTLLAANNLTNYQLILSSFEKITSYVNTFKGVIFNLGYLPKGDKTITTTKDITINTLTTLTSYLKQAMFIIITCYPGHPEGEIEAAAVIDFVSKLDITFRVYKYELINSFKNKPPFVVIIEKQ